MSTASLLFTVDDREGALEEVLKEFKNLSISLTRIESRPSKSSKRKYDIIVEFRPIKRDEGESLKALEKCLSRTVSNYHFIEPSVATDQDCKLEF